MSAPTKLRPADIKIDYEKQTLTIFGIQYSAAMFAHFAESKTMVGWHKVRSREGGVLRILTVPKDMQDTFDVIAGLK